MIEMARYKELKAFAKSHKGNSPEIVAVGYEINRNESKNVLEEHKERSLLAAIKKETGGNMADIESITYPTMDNPPVAEVHKFSELYPDMPTQPEKISYSDIPWRIRGEISKARPEALAKALGHYANELKPHLDKETFQELFELTEEADRVGHDVELLKAVQRKAAHFFGQLERNKIDKIGGENEKNR